GGAIGASRTSRAATCMAMAKVRPAMRAQFRPSRSSCLSGVGKFSVMRGGLGVEAGRHGAAVFSSGLDGHGNFQAYTNPAGAHHASGGSGSWIRELGLGSPGSGQRKDLAGIRRVV